MAVIIEGGEDTVIGTGTGRPFTNWKEARTLWWHTCMDNSTTIWPFQKAWYRVHTRPSPRAGEVDWLSGSAMTYRKLTQQTSPVSMNTEDCCDSAGPGA